MLLLQIPRDVVQVDVLGRQLGSRNLVHSAYKLATKEPFGHLLIDLDPRCSKQLQFCSHLTNDFSVFYIVGNSQKKIELDEQFTTSDYFQTAHQLQSCSSSSRLFISMITLSNF